MKYTIIIEKKNDTAYVATCPIINNIMACGTSVDSALTQLQQELICYLHDPEAELEIVEKKKKTRKARRGEEKPSSAHDQSSLAR